MFALLFACATAPQPLGAPAPITNTSTKVDSPTSSAAKSDAGATPEPAAIAASATNAPVAAASSPLDGPARIVAIGDVHGDPGSLIVALQLAELANAEGHWTGGTATLVQTGDTTDRGPDSRGVMALLRQLQAEAAAAGGQVIPLLGNHEVMNMRGDLRYVNPLDTEGYGGEAARKVAFSAAGDDGRWLRSLDAVGQVGSTVFCHGGVTSQWAALGLVKLNAEIRAGIDQAEPTGALGPDGPLWFRGYLLEGEPAACAELDQALASLGATRMVVGHTTQDSGVIASRCAGKLWGIDTGISAHYGNHYAALEIVGEQVRALVPAGTR